MIYAVTEDIVEMATLLNYKITQPEVAKHATPIMLIHGLFGDMNNLGMIARGLTDYTTIQVDVRNHGDSFHSDEMNYAVMAQDIVELIDALNIPELIIIGHSMGGKIAMAVTQYIPEKIKELIIIDVAPVAYTVHRHTEIFEALNLVSNEKVTDRKEAAELMRTVLHDEEFVVQFLLKSFRHGDWKFNVDILQQRYNDIIGWQTVPTFNKPTLFIIGGDSSYVQKEDQALITAQFSNANAKVISGAGHWVHAQKTDAVLRAIHNFLESHDN